MKNLENWRFYEDRKLHELSDEELQEVPIEILNERSEELTLRQMQLILKWAGLTQGE